MAIRYLFASTLLAIPSAVFAQCDGGQQAQQRVIIRTIPQQQVVVQQSQLAQPRVRYVEVREELPPPVVVRRIEVREEPQIRSTPVVIQSAPVILQAAPPAPRETIIRYGPFGRVREVRQR